MTAILAACQRSQRTATVDRTGGVVIQNVYKLIATSPASTQYEILQELAAGTTVSGIALPYVGVALGAEGNSCLKCIGVRLQSSDRSPKTDTEWLLTAEYSTSGDRAPSADPDPLLRYADVEFDEVLFREPVEKDADDNPIENSAHDPIPREKDSSNGIIRIKQNRPGPGSDTPWIWKTERDTYLLTTNAETFTVLGNSFGAGTVRLNSITPRLRYENCVFFWEVQYVFEYRESGWEDSFFDTGFAEFYPLIGRKQIVDVTGVPTPAGYFLDGGGLKLASGADPFPLSFVYYPAVSWSGLTFIFPS